MKRAKRSAQFWSIVTQTFAGSTLEKLGHFDKFWFYLDVKETVDWSQRRRTREMFHADVIFAGLF